MFQRGPLVVQERLQSGKLERSYQRLRKHKNLIGQARLELEELGGRHLQLEVRPSSPSTFSSSKMLQHVLT